MEKALLLSVVITILFGVLKFLEMKYLDKKLKPLRDVVRDIVMVFSASFASSMALLHFQDKIDDFLSVITNTNVMKAEHTQVFTGVPDF
jgi:predicted nuclease of restriction endonuclease-like RecB superfamily